MSFLVNSLEDYRLTVLQLFSLTKHFSIQISIIHDNSSSQVVDIKRWGFGQQMNSTIIHDNICSLIIRVVIQISLKIPNKSTLCLVSSITYYLEIRNLGITYYSFLIKNYLSTNIE